MEAFPVLDVSKNAVYQREVNVVRALAKHYQGTVPVIPTIFTPAHCIPEFCGGIEQARYYMDNHPEAVDAMLRALVQTELQLVDAYIAVSYTHLEEKKPEKFSLTFDGDRIRKYFPKSYTPLQMENTIIKLLEAWQKKRQRSQER